jgi:hypothetical protein
MPIDLLATDTQTTQPIDLLSNTGQQDLTIQRPSVIDQIKQGALTAGIGAGVAVPLAFGARKAFNVSKMIPTALSANYGVGYKADEFANKVNAAFVKTHTDKVA